ncbi:MAG: histone deacetylase family protein [Luteibaculaceae bacterium]
MLKIAFAPLYAHPLPEGHRFPMEKYRLLPQQLLYEGTAEPDSFFAPDPIAEQDILTTHCPDYWRRLKNLELTKSEIRKTGFPLSEQLVLRETIIAGGTIQGAYYAKEFGVSMNIAGGTHHAFTNRGEGFCLLNDQALAANYLLKNGDAKSILIVDLDVHQGNGTAEIFEQNPHVFTFSMHGGNNYPLQKEKSDLDVPLPDGISDKDYLTLLEENLTLAWEKAKPDFVFFQSGVDIIASDKLGRLGVSIAGCKQRDEMVLEKCWQQKVPVVCSMGGGYSPKIAEIIEAHANTYRTAVKYYF